MKKLHKVLLLILLAAPIFFIGCQKTDLNEESIQPTDDLIDNTSIDYKDYCGNTSTFTLNYWDLPDAFGSITIGNDESNLILNYDIDESNGYYIRETRIFIINDGITPPLTIADAWNPDGSAHFPDTDNFPFISDLINTKEHQTIITFAELEYEGIDLNECLDIVAVAALQDPTTNTWKTVFAKSSLKSYGWYVDFCLEPCVEPTCETAYAFGGDPDDCFLNLETQSNNWGWSNGGIPPGTVDSWPIWAGAGQCNTGNGTMVGTLDVDYDGAEVTITYNIDPAYSLDETHFHIGTSAAERLPVNKKGKFITAPGTYDHSGVETYTMTGLSGEDIYITAHGVVCGYY